MRAGASGGPEPARVQPGREVAEGVESAGTERSRRADAGQNETVPARGRAATGTQPGPADQPATESGGEPAAGSEAMDEELAAAQSTRPEQMGAVPATEDHVRRAGTEARAAQEPPGGQPVSPEAADASAAEPAGAAPRAADPAGGEPVASRRMAGEGVGAGREASGPVADWPGGIERTPRERERSEPARGERAPTPAGKEPVGAQLMPGEPAGGERDAQQPAGGEWAVAKPAGGEPAGAGRAGGERAVLRPVGGEPVGARRAAGEQAGAGREAPGPVGAEKSPAEPAGRESVGAEPVGAEPVGAEPVGAERVGAERTAAEPAGRESVGAERVGAERAGPERSRAEAAGRASVGAEPVGAEPVGAERVGAERVGPERSRAEPADRESVAAEPVGAEEGETPEAAGVEVVGTGSPVSLVRRIGSSRAAVLIGVLCGLLGFGLAVQVRSNNATSGLSTARQEDLVRILDDLSSREERLRRQIAALEAARARLTTTGDRNSAALVEARTRSTALGILAGTLPAQGPGIELRMTDPNDKLTGEDVLDAVEELRAAGAEAIQVGPVRIGLDSAFTERDGQIAADGIALPVPYVVVAIGEPSTLATALNIPGGVVDTVRQAGGVAAVHQQQRLVIRALRALPASHYAQPSAGQGAGGN